MLFQLASVPLSPRTVECRSGECQQRIFYSKQKWAQLLFFGNDLLVCFDRTSGRTVLQMKHLTGRKKEEFMEKSFMIPLSELKSMGSCMKLNTEYRVLGPEISLTSVQRIKKAFSRTIKEDFWLKNFVSVRLSTESFSYCLLSNRGSFLPLV